MTESREHDATEREAREHLAVIRALMEESRQAVQGGRPHYIIWGVLITAALLSTYVAEVWGTGPSAVWIWPAAIGLGWVLSLVIVRREGRRSRVRGPAGRIMMGIWIGAGVAMTLIGFGGMAGRTMTGSGLLAVIAAMLGAAQFATSYVLGSAVTRYLAMGWWAGAVAMLLWPGPQTLLVMAGLMVALHLVPGLVLPFDRADGRLEGAGTGRAS